MKITTLALSVAVALGATPAMAGRGGGGGGFHGGGGGFHGGGFHGGGFHGGFGFHGGGFGFRGGFRGPCCFGPGVAFGLGFGAGLGLARLGLALLRTCLLSATGVLRAASLLCPSASRVSSALPPRVMRPKATHPRATRRVMRLLRSVMCRRPQARHRRAIHSRHTIHSPTPIAEAAGLSLHALNRARHGRGNLPERGVCDYLVADGLMRWKNRSTGRKIEITSRAASE